LNEQLLNYWRPKDKSILHLWMFCDCKQRAL